MSAPSPPLELDRLHDWLAARGHRPERLEALTGDVSPRRYLRVRAAGTTAILAVYPPPAGDGCDRFRAASALLAAQGVRVPRILADDCAAGLMLVEDVGERTLYEHPTMPWPERERWLAAAIDIVGRVRRLDRQAVAALSPPLDAALLRRELQQTAELVLAPRGMESPALNDFLDRLAAEAGRGPLVPAHRDLMVRNLVPLGDGELAVLDHQDLRLAPPAYDVASLLNDSWFPAAAIEERLLRRAASLGFDRRAYDLTALQRTLKAAGTYAAFARRGADRHLPLLRPTLERALTHWRRLEIEPELAERVAERLAESC